MGRVSIFGSSSGGGVSGPGSSTDNALARFDGTGGATLQNSVATLDDNGALSIEAQSAGTTVLTAIAASSPTANMVEIQDNSNNILTHIDENGVPYLQAPSSEPADVDFENSQLSFWLDETNNKFNLKAKKSGGSVIEGKVVAGYREEVFVAAESTNGAAGTNRLHRVVPLDDATTETVRFSIKVPENWDSSQNPSFSVAGFSSGTGTSQNYRFELGNIYTKDSEAVDGTVDETVTFTAAAPDADDTMIFTTEEDLDKTGIEAGDLVACNFSRLGGDAADTRSGDFQLAGIIFYFPI